MEITLAIILGVLFVMIVAAAFLDEDLGEW
jgi:hypothetical protein